jgi:hypothetical protein
MHVQILAAAEALDQTGDLNLQADEEEEEEEAVVVVPTMVRRPPQI